MSSEPRRRMRKALLLLSSPCGGEERETSGWQDSYTALLNVVSNEVENEIKTKHEDNPAEEEKEEEEKEEDITSMALSVA